MELYKGNEEILPEETMREMERVYLLKNVDTYWMDHIDAMEQLKQGIRLRAYGQRDPVVEYRFEGFDMFDQMIATIRENTVKMVLVAPRRILAIQKQQEEMQRRAMEQQARAAAAAKAQQERAAAAQEQARLAAQQAQQNQKLNVVFKREQVAKPTATSGDGTDSANRTVRKTAKQKVGRNDPCPCGSGKKYKKCCGRDE